MKESELWWNVVRYYERAIAEQAEVVTSELMDALRQECARAFAPLLMLNTMRARYREHISLMDVSDPLLGRRIDWSCNSWSLGTISYAEAERRLGVRAIAATLLALECEEEERD